MSCMANTLRAAFILVSLCTTSCQRASTPTPMSSRAFLNPASNDTQDLTLRPLTKADLNPARGSINPGELTRDMAWVESFWRGINKEDAESHPYSLKPIHFIDRAAPFIDGDQICFDVEIHDDALHERTFEQMQPSCTADGLPITATVLSESTSQATLWYRYTPVSVTATGSISVPLDSTAAALHASVRLGVLCCQASPKTTLELRFSNELYGDGSSPWSLTFTWDVTP